nr:hypothetical protein GCM10020092_053520 [Actinoplanes digitatis]
MKSSIWAIVWFEKLLLITNDGCPVALPRFSRRPSDNTITAWPSSNLHSSTCGLIVIRRTSGRFARLSHVDLVVEVPDVADDGLVLHPGHVLVGDHAEAAGRGDEDVRGLHDVVHGGDLVAVHRGLQRADRVDLGDDDPGTLTTQRLGAALAHVAVTVHHGNLAADEDVGGAVDAVDQRVPAAVPVVELALGDRVVDVDRREEQPALLLHLVQPVHAGGGLLGDTPDTRGEPGPAPGILAETAPQHRQDDRVLLGVGGIRGRDRAEPLELRTLVHQQRGVATVVQDHVGARTVGPQQRPLGAPPVLLQRLALPGVDRHARGRLGGAARADDDRRRGVVLSGEDVARGPADLRAERGQCLDQDRGLDGHVQRTGHPRATQRLSRAVLLTQRHQAGHLMLGQLDLLTPEPGERKISNLEVSECHGLSRQKGAAVTGAGISKLVAGRRAAQTNKSANKAVRESRPKANADYPFRQLDRTAGDVSFLPATGGKT